MKKGKEKILSISIILTIIFQILIPIIPELNIKVFAAENAEEIPRNYEIKEEESWDVSKNGDGSVIAKWTLKDRTLTISGTGEMKDWEYSSQEDWHNTQYTYVIEKVIIETGVINLGRYAFKECSSLTNIIIPQGVTSIESYAFYGCSSLTNIEIPEGVISIGGDVFSGCSSLRSINVSVNNKNYMSENGILFDKEKKEIKCYPSAKDDINKYIIPEGVTSIRYSAFEGCISLTNIEIPEGVTSIGSSAFEGCISLTNIEIPEGVTSIEWNAFSGCSSLVNIEIPQGVTSIGNEAFYGCSSLTNIEIPEGVTSIESGTFEGCSSLTNIIIPEGVTSIGSDVFLRCSSLTNIIIPEGVTSIGRTAFYECSSLTNIIIPEGVTSIGESAFEGCSGLTNIEIPEGVTSIGRYAFYKCNSLTNVEIPEGLTTIEEFVFYECSSLTNIIIPKGVTSIGYDAFLGCSSLTNIIIPEGVTSIGDEAFDGCSSLTNIVIPEGVTSMGESIFEGCSSLTNIVIPEGVTSMGESIFEECSSLTNIEIPKGLTSIGWYAFKGCSSLTNIEIPEGVTSIEVGTFLGCSSLTNIEIPKGITSIGNVAFSGCSSLTDIEIPEGVTSIGDRAFSGCSSLTNIEIPEGVTSIGGSAFEECNSLRNIVIPEGVTSIGETIFLGCKNLINYSKSNSNAHRYLEENKYKYIVDDEGPIIKYTPNGSINQQKEYNVKIDVKDNISEVGVRNSSLKFQWTQSINPPSKESFIESFENGQTINKNTGDGIWYLWVYAEDKIGNGTITKEVFDFDNTIPSINVVYSTKNPTKENVKVTITSNEEIQKVEGWRLSEDKRVLTKEYEQNVTEEITIKDIAGNETQASIEIANIDKKAPDINVEYSTKNPTKEKVKVKITSNEEIQEVEGWILSEDKRILTKEYEQNVTEEITIKDIVGNERLVNIEIGNIIDEKPPIIEVKYNTKNPTKKNVIVTITSNEEIQEVEGWILSEDKRVLTKEYTQNTEEEITIKDLAGNETQVSIEIANIDRKAPDISVEYSTKDPTKENVTVTITSNEEIQEVEGWTLSEDKRVLTKEYTQNTDAEITIKDLAGNETSVNIEISNIQKTAIGDINQDGKSDITDMLMLKRHLVAGNKKSWILTGNSLLRADINDNGVVDITDLLMLKRKIINSI